MSYYVKTANAVPRRGGPFLIKNAHHYGSLVNETQRVHSQTSIIISTWIKRDDCVLYATVVFISKRGWEEMQDVLFFFQCSVRELH